MGDDRNHRASESNHLIKLCGSQTNETQIFLLKIKMEMGLFRVRGFCLRRAVVLARGDDDGAFKGGNCI